MASLVMVLPKKSLTIDTFNSKKIIFNYIKDDSLTINDIINAINTKIKYRYHDIDDYSLCLHDGIPCNKTQIINNDVSHLKMVETKNILQIISRDERLINVKIEALSGKIYDMPIHPESKVNELKYWFGAKNSIPMDQINFVFKGKLLDNDKTLTSYGIENDTSIIFTLRLRGGMYQEISGRNGAYKVLDSITIFDLDTNEFINY